jgi:thymidylate kinase
MKLVLAIEGMDGSGKSSLAEYLREHCARDGLPFTQVGRRDCAGSPAVVKLTHLLYEESRRLTPRAEIFLRLAREYQRAQLAAAVPAGLVVLDRFVLSVLSLARVHELNTDLLRGPLEDIVRLAGLHATIFVQCPFEIACGRVRERRPRTPDRKARAEKMLRRISEFMQEDFQRGQLTGKQWLVDNSDTLAGAEAQLRAHLRPYLRQPLLT